MDPVTIGAVLLAIVTGASSQLGTQLWQGVVTLVRRPFHHTTAASGEAAVTAAVLSGEAELAALQRDPADRHAAVALAKVLLARSDMDIEFRRALESWWNQSQAIGMSTGNATNIVTGGTQHGPVIQGRDFTGINIGAAPVTPPIQPS
jgi:hypothetical protein